MRFAFLAIPLACVTLAGCVENQSDQSYNMPASQQMHVRIGTIVGERRVQVQTTDSGQVALGTLAGAAVGGVLGNQFGKGSGNTAMTMIGAGAGAVVGNNMASQGATNVTYRRAWEVRMRNGERILVLRDGGRFRVGERVRVVGDGNHVHLEHL